MSAGLLGPSGWGICQSDRVLANGIGGNKAEWRPRAGKEWLAATEHDGVEVEPILIDETKVGQAPCQVWSRNCNLASEPSLQATYDRPNVLRN